MESSGTYNRAVWVQRKVETSDDFGVTTSYVDDHLLHARARQSEPREAVWASQLNYRSDWKLEIRYGRAAAALRPEQRLRLIVDGQSHTLRITQVRDRRLQHHLIDVECEELHA